MSAVTLSCHWMGLCREENIVQAVQNMKAILFPSLNYLVFHPFSHLELKESVVLLNDVVSLIRNFVYQCFSKRKKSKKFT